MYTKINQYGYNYIGKNEKVFYFMPLYNYASAKFPILGYYIQDFDKYLGLNLFYKIDKDNKKYSLIKKMYDEYEEFIVNWSEAYSGI